jgi:hypothetical protein
MKKIIIIGSGWYGCHIASLLKNTHDVTIIEKNNDIFNNSSYFNQNRLHIGYHYCRNYNTRQLCNQNYNRVLNKYNNLVDDIKNNYYIISNNSIIDFNTFTSIYNYEGFEFETIPNTSFNNIDGSILKVKEKVINSDKAYNYFKNELIDVNIIYNTTIQSYSKQDTQIKIIDSYNNEYVCDILLDCTYNQLGLSSKKYIYEQTISLLCKRQNNTSFDAVTIMDGNFSSLYPRDISNNVFTLTDVEFTPLIKSDNYADIKNFELTDKMLDDVTTNMISKFKKYYPQFETDFEYYGYFLSKKTKLNSATDSRETTIEKIEDNVYSVNGGKIYGIFEWEEYIKTIFGL